MRICGQQQSPCIAISLPVCEMGKEQPVPPSSPLSPFESPAPLSEGQIPPIHSGRKEIQAFPGGGSRQRPKAVMCYTQIRWLEETHLGSCFSRLPGERMVSLHVAMVSQGARVASPSLGVSAGTFSSSSSRVPVRYTGCKDSCEFGGFEPCSTHLPASWLQQTIL